MIDVLGTVRDRSHPCLALRLHLPLSLVPGPRGTGSRLVQRLSYWHSRFFFGGFVRMRVRGREHCPRTGPFLLAANHLSPFDPFLLTLATRRWIDWVAMVELYRRPAAAWYWDALAAIPVDRARVSRAAAVTILKRLADGRVVGIFPEGGIRTREQSVLAGGGIHAGACRLALAVGVPLVPVAIVGSETMTGVRGWLWPRRAFKVDVIFGAPLAAPAGKTQDAKIAAEERKVLLAAAMQELGRLADSG